MRRSLMFLTVLLAIPLAACSTAGPYRTPLEQLGDRVTHAAAVGNRMNADVQSTLVCPRGMVAEAGGHQVEIENRTRFEYEEESPGRGSRGSTRGRLRGDFSTYSSQDVRVEAETETRSQGRVICVPVDLTPAQR